MTMESITSESVLDTKRAVMESKSPFLQGSIDLLAGSLGGVAVVYTSQPLDTVKVKMQTFPNLYKNMGGCLIETLKKDGIARGLYAGSVPAVIANVAENSVLFAAYGFCQQFVATLHRKESVEQLNAIHNAEAGFFAAFFSTFTLCPTELVKCKLQALRETHLAKGTVGEFVHVTPLQMTKQVLRAEGIPGLYRGLSSTMMREMPGYFFFFGGYEGTRSLFLKPGQTKDDLGLIPTMVAGAAGGVSLWTMIFPFDVIKSRVQVNNLKDGMITVGLKIAREEGIAALYTGLKPTILRTIPATAALFVVYEYSKKFMTSLFT